MNRNTPADIRTYLTRYQEILDTMIRKMTEAPLTDSISHNFIVQMIPHHRAAIEMSRNVLHYTTNPELRRIASGIIIEQTKSIENMQKILSHCSSHTNTQRELCRYQTHMDAIMQTMFSRMKNARTTSNITCDFMWEMIPHHMGAVEMSTLTLKAPICPQLIPILTAINTSQKRGIAEMQALLKQIGC